MNIFCLKGCTKTHIDAVLMHDKSISLKIFTKDCIFMPFLLGCCGKIEHHYKPHDLICV